MGVSAQRFEVGERVQVKPIGECSGYTARAAAGSIGVIQEREFGETYRIKFDPPAVVSGKGYEFLTMHADYLKRVEDFTGTFRKGDKVTFEGEIIQFGETIAREDQALVRIVTLDHGEGSRLVRWFDLERLTFKEHGLPKEPTEPGTIVRLEPLKSTTNVWIRADGNGEKNWVSVQTGGRTSWTFIVEMARKGDRKLYLMGGATEVAL